MGRLDKQVLQVLPTLTPSFTNFPRENLQAEIVLHRSNVYVSNRGGDSIATYSINPTTGQLHISGFPPSAGKSPRHLLLSTEGTNETMWVSNEDTGSIAAFTLQRGDLILQSNTSGVESIECIAVFKASQLDIMS